MFIVSRAAGRDGCASHPRPGSPLWQRSDDGGQDCPAAGCRGGGRDGGVGGRHRLADRLPALLAVGIAPLARRRDAGLSRSWPPGQVPHWAPSLNCAGRAHGCGRQAALAAAGSAAGAALLLVTPADIFGRVVPFLLAFAALALLLQPQISAWLAGRRVSTSRFLLPGGLVAVSAYDGSGAPGRAVMTLALLMITTGQGLTRSNALKNMLLGVADVACCVVFVLFWPIGWAAAALMARRSPDWQHDRAVPHPAPPGAHSPRHRRARWARSPSICGPEAGNTTEPATAAPGLTTTRPPSGRAISRAGACSPGRTGGVGEPSLAAAAARLLTAADQTGCTTLCRAAMFRKAAALNEAIRSCPYRN